MTSRAIRHFLLVALASCASDESNVHFNAASGYTVVPTSASIYGVFHDGRLDPAAWDEYARVLSPLGHHCDARFTRAWVSDHTDDAKTIADDVRQNGFSDDLLAKISSSAQGDAVLVLVVAGKPPVTLGHETRQRAVNPAQMTKPASTTYVHTITDGNAFEIGLMIYSVKEHRSVAELNMTYQGQDMSAALHDFTDSLGKSFPGWKCAGWND